MAGAHFPTGFTYSWWLVVVNAKGTKFVKLLKHGQQTFRPSFADEGRRIACRVDAYNDAGGRTAASNSYVVPVLAPQPTSAPLVTMATEEPHRDQVVVTSSTHATLPGYTSNEWAYYTTIAEKIYLSCNTGTWNRPGLSFTTRWFSNGQATDIVGDTVGNDFVSISDPYTFTKTIDGPNLRFNFSPANSQEPTLFNGQVTCMVTATTPTGVQSDSSSLRLTIWNGCDVGIEPWDTKILREGPLCGDYAPYYSN